YLHVVHIWLRLLFVIVVMYFFFQAEDGIRCRNVTGVQTCALPILLFLGGGEDPCIGGGRKFVKQLQFLKKVGYRHVTGKMYPGKIGRASCRERVWIWVGAG